MFLSDSVKRQLSEQTTEEVQHPGQATTALGLVVGISKIFKRLRKSTGFESTMVQRYH